MAAANTIRRQMSDKHRKQMISKSSTTMITTSTSTSTTKIESNSTFPALTKLVFLMILCLAIEAKRSDDEIVELNYRHCDSGVCDLIVAKCNLLNRCDCKVKREVSCFKECVDCLEEKFGVCCACVGLCPRKLGDSHSSHVANITRTDQQLFEILTETDDLYGRWSINSPRTGLQVSHPELGQIEIAYRRDNNNLSSISHDPNLEKLKCTVAFINKHLSMAKCKHFCTSMGASAYRWFHDGCCECVGKNCVNYGIDEPQCDLSPDDYDL